MNAVYSEKVQKFVRTNWADGLFLVFNTQSLLEVTNFQTNF